MASYFIVLQSADRELRLIEIFHGDGRGGQDELNGAKIAVSPSRHSEQHKAVRKALNDQGFTTPLINFRRSGARKQTALLAGNLAKTLNSTIKVVEERGGHFIRDGEVRNGRIVWYKRPRKPETWATVILPPRKRYTAE